jgi:hypothetical protein
MSRPKRLPQTHEEFVFHLRTPSVHYSFGIQHERGLREERPFDERESVQFVTECIWPDRFRGREGMASLNPEPVLVDHKLLNEHDNLRQRFGYIRATRSTFETVVWLPPRMCWRLAEAVALGLVLSMITNGLVEQKGMNRLTYVSFDGKAFDPVAYVG